MIKEALQYINGLTEAKILEIHDQQYSDKELYRIDKHIPKANALEMHTLTSLVDYIKSNTDMMPYKMLIQVVSPTEVRLFSMLDENRRRENLVNVEAQIPSFSFGSFIDHEQFCINVQAKFISDPNTDKDLILKFAGTVEAGSVAEYGDNGVTQKATIKTGIASKTDALVPNPVTLRPYRTFIEVEQPVSDFIFRMKQDKYDGINCAVFEADGGAWKNVAMKNIKDYLEFELAGYEYITVIS